MQNVHTQHHHDAEPFGALLGYAPGGGAIYSSNYNAIDTDEVTSELSFKSYIDHEYMGYKWQCVEFARRFMFTNYGLVFTDVEMAYQIFSLRYIRSVFDDGILPFYAFENGSCQAPVPGGLVIWKAQGEFSGTGHVAVITQLLTDRIRVAEQNVTHSRLPAGQQWTRELQMRSDNGRYYLDDTFDDTVILGWMGFSDANQHALPQPAIKPEDLRLQAHRLKDPGVMGKNWLKAKSSLAKAYIKANDGCRFNKDPARYYVMGKNAEQELHKATNELHLMYLHATDKVIRQDSLLELFDIPKILWPRLRMSWQRRRHEIITGRMDFAMDERGLKLYEYNADSASCHTEAAFVLRKWFKKSGIDQGEIGGNGLMANLSGVWKYNTSPRVVHILYDKDPEEEYHALFFQRVLKKAGIEGVLVKGMHHLTWDHLGRIVDDHGHLVTCVWKTWSWETVLDEIRMIDEAELAAIPIHTGKPDTRVRLVDVLLRPGLDVYEPLWTLIPSNKAILPVLWSLFPGHRYLLHSSFDVNDQLRSQGYAIKPISGRCGLNIHLVNEHDEIIDRTDGKFAEVKSIYQQLWCLPRIGEDYIQVSAFVVAGNYGGACLRSDPSRVIKQDSDIESLIITDN